MAQNRRVIMSPVNPAQLSRLSADSCPIVERWSTSPVMFLQFVRYSSLRSFREARERRSPVKALLPLRLRTRSRGRLFRVATTDSRSTAAKLWWDSSSRATPPLSCLLVPGSSSATVTPRQLLRGSVLSQVRRCPSPPRKSSRIIVSASRSRSNCATSASSAAWLACLSVSLAWERSKTKWSGRGAARSRSRTCLWVSVADSTRRWI
mmetsp:Transcript_29/g.97  ORF Transcript_29/g.97 Transcript_29/m.97 type:complete len:207 (-) Transcript_29:1165-1785(-)